MTLLRLRLAGDLKPVGVDTVMYAYADAKTAAPQAPLSFEDSNENRVSGRVSLGGGGKRHADHQRDDRRSDVAEQFGRRPEILEVASAANQPQIGKRALLEPILLSRIRSAIR